MNFRGLKLDQVVDTVVSTFGLNAVVQEMQRQEDVKREKAVAELDAAIMRFGTSMGIPPYLVQQHLTVGATLTGRMASKGPVSQSIKRETPKPTPANIGQVAADVITSVGWDFTQEYSRDLKDGHTIVNLVGQHFRPKKAQDTLASKKQYNMALLVAEPTNPADVNAVMVLMWNHTEKGWHHVGYVRADQAAKLRSCWPEDDVRKVRVATITEMPSGFDGHRTGKNLTMALTGEYRTYPAFQRLV